MRSELEQRNLYAAAAFGIYNRKKIIDRNLFFKEGILHEDEEWTPRVLLNLDTVYLSEFNFYHYIKRPGSITTSDSTSPEPEPVQFPETCGCAFLMLGSP